MKIGPKTELYLGYIIRQSLRAKLEEKHRQEAKDMEERHMRERVEYEDYDRNAYHEMVAELIEMAGE